MWSRCQLDINCRSNAILFYAMFQFLRFWQQKKIYSRKGIWRNKRLSKPPDKDFKQLFKKMIFSLIAVVLETHLFFFKSFFQWISCKCKNECRYFKFLHVLDLYFVLFSRPISFISPVGGESPHPGLPVPIKCLVEIFLQAHFFHSKAIK